MRKKAIYLDPKVAREKRLVTHVFALKFGFTSDVEDPNSLTDQQIVQGLQEYIDEMKDGALAKQWAGPGPCYPMFRHVLTMRNQP